MVATPYLGEFSVAHSPTQWQQGNAQSQHNFQGLQKLDSVCANDNSVRQSVHNGGQQRHWNMQKESNLNIDTGLQHRQNLNFAFSVDATSAARQGNAFGITAQTCHSLSQCSSLPGSKMQRTYPLLFSLLKVKPPDYKEFVTTPPSLSGKTNAKIELNTNTHFSDDLDQSASSQSYSGKVLPFGEMLPSTPPTDDDIQAFILRSVVDFTTQDNQSNGYAHSHSTCPSGCMPKTNSKAHHSKTSFSDKDDMDLQILNCAASVLPSLDHCPAALGHWSKGSRSNTELIPMSKERRDCASSASKKHSTEYPQIVGKVAASRTKNEDESPAIIAVPSVTLDELTEKHPSSSLHCSSSQEQHKSLGENINKNLDDTEQMPGVSWALRHMKYRDKGATGLKPVDAVWLDNVQGVTYVLEDLKTKSSSVPSENKISEPTFTENQEKQNPIAHCKLNSSTVQIDSVLSVTTNQINQLCNQTSYEVAREDLCFVYPQTDVRIALSENNVKEQASLSEREGKEGSYVRFLKDPKYEDISDNEDMPQLDTKLPVPERGDLSVAIGFEDLQYEDISEDENSQTGNMTPERHLLTQAPESEKYLHVQVLEDEDETVDEMSDDWIVIPIEISGLRFEPENEYCKNQEKVVPIDGASRDKTQLDTGPTLRDCNRPAPALSSQIEVFDTRESFLKAQGVPFPSICEMALGCHSTEYEMDALGEPQNKRVLASDAEESSQTEDSYDYSSGSELNFMTPSRKSWNKGLAADEKKVEGEVEQKLERLIQAEAASKPVQQNTNGQKTSKIATIIIDSDTEDESDQNCKKKAESKGWFSDLDSNEHSHCSQQKRHSPGIVKKFRKKRLHCTEKNGQLIKTKGASDYVQQNIQKSSKNETYDIVILDSDSDQNCNEVNGRRLFSSVSAEGDDAPCVQQRTHSAETVDGKTAKEKLREAQLSSTGSSLPQYKSKLCYSRIKKATQDAHSDLSHGTEKKRQLVEAKSDSGHVQQKTNRPRIPEQRGNAKRRLSSRSEDNDYALFAIKSRHSAETVDSLCQTTNKKPKTTRLSSEVQKKQPQSVEKEVDSTLGLNPLMPRLVNQQSSQPMEGLKLLKCTVHMQGDDKTQVPKTPTETCKKTAGTALYSHRNKKVRFETPANDGNHLKKNMVQAIVEKSKRSFPCQESPAPFNSSSIHDSCREARPGPSHYDRAPRQRHNSPRVSNPTETRSQQVRGEVLNPSRTPSEKAKCARNSHLWTNG